MENELSQRMRNLSRRRELDAAGPTDPDAANQTKLGHIDPEALQEMTSFSKRLFQSRKAKVSLVTPPFPSLSFRAPERRIFKLGDQQRRGEMLSFDLWLLVLNFVACAILLQQQASKASEEVLNRPCPDECGDG